MNQIQYSFSMRTLLYLTESPFLLTVVSTSKHCNCPDKEEPVCGEDGFTHHNSCFMQCEGVYAAEDPLLCCRCNNTYDPVCGINDRSYGNLCMASCRGVRVRHHGECPRLTTRSPCSDVYEPVCGADGMTYANPCKASQAKSRIISNGECPRRCACPRLYRPVCGEDGVTYPNRCVAGCMSGVHVYEYGECPQEDNRTEDKGGQGLLDRIRSSPLVEIRTS